MTIPAKEEITVTIGKELTPIVFISEMIRCQSKRHRKTERSVAK